MGNLQTEPVDDRDKNVAITTWNGAASYGSVNDPLVELFFKSVRNMPCSDYRSVNVKLGKNERKLKSSPTSGKSIEDYFDKAWKSDPLRTLKFVFYLRDCRGGKGERKLFRAIIRHMRERELSEHIIKNMQHIPTFGSWKDIPLCFLGTSLEYQAILLIANQLMVDRGSGNPSLCAKYSPSEGGAFDKAHNAASKISRAIGISVRDYRKIYLSPLRSQLNIIERDMCARGWNEITYEKVPSIAGSRYKKAFNRHDEQRYTEYLKSVQRGEKKMNTGVLMPYQIVAPYLKNTKRVEVKDETCEAQWMSFLDDRRSKCSSGVNILPLIDVSGSMFDRKEPQAVQVAVSLGMVFSLLNSTKQYKGKFITFDDHPKLLSIQGDSLMDQVNFIKGTKWGGNTDFQAALDLILSVGTTFNVSADDMPQILLILSDMQFNEADGGKTNWSELESKYASAGYKRPTIIFWNLNGNSVDYPVPDSHVPNCALLSGFNDAIMYSILDGTIPNPVDVVHDALDKERYDVIRLAEKVG